MPLTGDSPPPCACAPAGVQRAPADPEPRQLRQLLCLAAHHGLPCLHELKDVLQVAGGVVGQEVASEIM